MSSRYRGTGTATTQGAYVVAAAEKVNERRTLVDGIAKWNNEGKRKTSANYDQWKEAEEGKDLDGK